MAKSIDINHIAKMAGVSRSTVSRVLTNSINVKAETADKIREAMLHCNYKPNPMARGLVTGKINIIAVVVSDITIPFYSELVALVCSHLKERGYLVCLHNFGNVGGDNDEYLETLCKYGFAGIIIADARNDPAFATILKAAHCPVVLLNRYIETVLGYDSIMIDNFLGGYMATKHLLELGHRSIAMLTGPGKSTSSSDRHKGYLQALSDYNVMPNKSLIVEGDLLHASGFNFANMLFKDNSRKCSAIFAGSDIMAIGIMSRCHEMGVRIPEDVSLVGFDDIPMAGTSQVNLTTVQQPTVQLGSLVAEQIDARIKGDDGLRQRITLVPKLIIRSTTGKYDSPEFSIVFPANQCGAGSPVFL